MDTDAPSAAQTLRRWFFWRASLAVMHARAEWMARSGPHRRGAPVRMAAAQREISLREAWPRSLVSPPAALGRPGAVEVCAGGLLSEASSAAPPPPPAVSTVV